MIKIKRRQFLNTTFSFAGMLFLPSTCHLNKSIGNKIPTVTGDVMIDDLGVTLVHEHILVDFIGADQVNQNRYDEEQVYKKVLPYLKQVKKKGCNTIVECTPLYLGRNVKLLQRLSKASGLLIISNTGYYGAMEGKYLPEHAFLEDAEKIAERWIRESKNGIDGTKILPGFIKTGVDKGPLTEVNKKLLKAAAFTHLVTGLTISAHTGDGAAALEEIEILIENGVSPEAFRWVHAQGEKDTSFHTKIGTMGAWVEFDGIGPETITEHVEFVKSMKENGLLGKVLLSHDAGWYQVGEAEGGDFRPYTSLYDLYIPALQKEGFSETELHQLLVKNPSQSFLIKVRKAN
ncbi:MAG: phosphotriesterase [Bacteroidota bacterium]|nr:phosphotriesterase [Bacteroidota bacterium]